MNKIHIGKRHLMHNTLSFHEREAMAMGGIPILHHPFWGGVGTYIP